jgi:hypothetical protein
LRGKIKTPPADVGRAGEFLVAQRIELAGWSAVPATVGGVDLIAMRGARVVRVQVKTRGRPTAREQYQFPTSRGTAARALVSDDCDVVAFVALDIGRVLYRPVSDVPLKTTSIRLREMTAEAEAESFHKSFGVTK